MSGNELINLWILLVILGEDSYRGAIGRGEVLTKILHAPSVETLRSVPSCLCL